MRKLYLVIASSVALVAFMGFSVSAFALSDPDCVPNDVELQNFSIATPDSDVAHEVSGVNGTGRACGSNISNGWYSFPGEGTLYQRADITIPPGVVVAEAPSARIPVDSHVGEAQIDGLSWLDLGPLGTYAAEVPDSQPNLVARPKSECQAEREALGDPGSEADIVACYYGEVTGDIHAEAWNWVVDNGSGALTLTIGEFHNLSQTHVPAGLTEIDAFDLCAYAGAPGSGACGTDTDPFVHPFVQRNGDGSFSWFVGPGSAYKCPPGSGGREPGVYTATATMFNGTTTPAASTKVRWKSCR